MDNKIKKAVEEFKQENGNEKFTTKDMLMYLVHRVDDLPCAKHIDEIGEIKGDVKTIYSTLKSWRWTTGILMTIILAVIGFSTLI